MSVKDPTGFFSRPGDPDAYPHGNVTSGRSPSVSTPDPETSGEEVVDELPLHPGLGELH